MVLVDFPLLFPFQVVVKVRDCLGLSFLFALVQRKSDRHLELPIWMVHGSAQNWWRHFGMGKFPRQKIAL